MRISTALVACLVLGLGVSSVPPETLLGALAYFGWLHALIAVAILFDTRWIRLNQYATGLGKWRWRFWVVFLFWPFVAIPWYFTIREWVLTGRTPRRPVAAPGVATG